MSKQLLIIDDDKELCQELKEILDDIGYQVDISNDGMSGKNALKKRNYELVLLDLKVPKVDGFAVLEWLKQDRKDIKVIVVTGRPLRMNWLKDDKVKGRMNEREEMILKLADDVINKPFGIDYLIQKISSLL